MKTNYAKYVMVILLAIFSWHYSMLSCAHEGHAEPLEKNKVVEKANKVISMAIEQNKLEPSWKEAKADEPKLIDEDKGGQWVIKYTNSKINKDNQLFIFFTLDGKYIAMNYTGK
ncbi:MAG: hypothetical protein HYX61_07510 [Gammaproteobacteria bacterium]|jgi:hypothetical protein|nr:hypothetical protein [Gammaproteobacteria bacterium]